ncbi:LPXTG-motif cell wall anchor domain-containing protein/fimbrial isopeptide formation D2 domain-containing protein [Ruminococcus flavefaciens]|uniref:LPXTG-motif cell wall anchor domain-containing protein/fimbrial isopeptide formation D2 domain-containing protein n=1 Tax=Ruminococcus flavefaciens TaxID=1265 RepID=A0A1H6J252_RUMFL|nr:isopeptide-forming domain-containing fimbrial protein [Ruminococcus flavefaciens]SEH52832.1 LPXTG-motif cell wall anchor domain-containing protein/fimbrial isopeptide formation D2 domain-containing protein [Ruminococcus flavefaciens]
MKNSKRFLAMMTAGFLAITPMAATGLTAFADYTITVDNATAGYSYAAYQIFSGDLDGDVLSNIGWATGVNGSGLIAALQADTLLGSEFTSVSTPAAVAAKLVELNANTEKLVQFAKIAKNYVNSTASGTQNTQTGSTYPITVTNPGYYLIEETSVPTGATVSRYMLEVVKSTTVTPKRPSPTINKTITGGADSGKANNVSIGDAVTYNITSAVPDMTGYDKYFFVINDDMAAGLTFNNDVAITIGSTTLTSSQFEVQTDSTETDGHTFQIVFNDFYNTWKTHSGDTISVTYTATLNEDADRTTAGNLNTATLTYSNNPNVTSTGTNEPTPPGGETPGDPVGTTPASQTKTYTANIKLTKKDGSGNVLTGAKFRLSGGSENVVLVNGKAYQLDNTNGTYYKLKNGTFTTTEPSGDTSAYDATDKKYKIVENVSSSKTYSNICMDAYVQSDGTLEFGGLGAGTYTLSEIVTPGGYNSIPDMTIVINGTGNTFASPNWSATKDGTSVTMTDTATVAFDVINNAGSTLPTTGGIGTKLFYIIGGLLVAGSVVLLVTKKRMKTNED